MKIQNEEKLFDAWMVKIIFTTRIIIAANIIKKTIINFHKVDDISNGNY